jgi:deoxyribonuclease-4
MVKSKLKLGFSINLPIIYDKKLDSSITNIIENKIKYFSKNFECIQIMFTKSKLSFNEIKDIKFMIKYYKYIYIHASYQINIGSDLIPIQNDLYSIGIEILLNEIEYAIKINANGIILHMGKNVKNRYNPSHIYNNMVIFIIELFKKLKFKKIKIPILLETPSGQGGDMCWDLLEFVEFIIRFKSQLFYSQLCICIDTCHIFQAGYDLNNLKIIKEIHKIFEPIKEKIILIHLNDSLYKVGSKIDRHEQIGLGYIKTKKLIKFIQPYKLIPMILETKGPYKEQINKLKNI